MKKLILLFALLCAPAFGQVYSEQAIQNTQGNWLKASPGALVYLCVPASSLTDCISGVAATSLYTNQNLNVIGPNPITADSNGNFTLFTNPGTYNMCVKGATTYCQLISVAGNASNHILCGAAINGSIAAFTDPTTTSCDPTLLTDFAGNLTGQSAQFLGPVNGFTTYIGGGSSPGTLVKFKLPANAVRIMAPNSVGTPYYLVPPPTRGANGQVIGKAAETTDGNGDPVVITQWQTSGTGVEAQVGGVDNANCTAGVCPLVNFIAGSNITISNPSGGQVQIASSGASVVRALDPSTPTITPTGVTGATNYSYVIVGNQNCIAGTTFHSTASAVGSTSTGNATLTNSNYNLIAGYGDALYGYRGYDIYRTVGAATQGKIVTCAGKAFKDTGLTGDATTAPNTNTTQLDPAGLLRPGTLSCNSMFHSPDGVDAPPCTPNAADDEFTESSSLTPAGVNDGVWSAYNALSSTFALTNGTITLTSDTAANQVEGITIALPATPYTYIAYITMESTVAPNVCALSLLESSTGKNVGVGFLQNQALNSGSWAGGTVVTELVIGATTSFTGTSTNFLFDIGFSSGYFKIQNDGTNINISYSTGNDGVFYKSLPSQLVSSHYTSAPNKLLLWTGSSASGAGTCVVDYVRRIQ